MFKIEAHSRAWEIRFYGSQPYSAAQSPGPEHNCKLVLEQRCAASAKLEVKLELNERLR